jgi:hypothetical protein
MRRLYYDPANIHPFFVIINLQTMFEASFTMNCSACILRRNSEAIFCALVVRSKASGHVTNQSFSHCFLLCSQWSSILFIPNHPPILLKHHIENHAVSRARCNSSLPRHNKNALNPYQAQYSSREQDSFRRTRYRPEGLLCRSLHFRLSCYLFLRCFVMPCHLLFVTCGASGSRVQSNACCGLALGKWKEYKVCKMMLLTAG